MNVQNQQFMSERFQTDIGGRACKFPLGEICATASVLSKITSEDLSVALRRHVQGDWGELVRYGQADNDQRLHTGGPLASIFHSERGIEFYILTEADRSTTTILLPEEY